MESAMEGCVAGTVAEGYESVKDMFEANFKCGCEKNAQLCVYVDGKMVVDLWGSVDKEDHYSADSLTVVFSSGKTLSSIVVAQLVEAGLLSYTDTIASHWPEFSSRGKGEITVCDLLRHEAGLVSLDAPIDLDNFLPDNIKANKIGEIVEQTEPKKEDPEEREYHESSRGVIINELVRRVDPGGRTVGEILREDVTGPLGADAFIGLREEELDRVCHVTAKEWSPTKVLTQSIVPKAMGRKLEMNILGLAKIAWGLRKVSPHEFIAGVDLLKLGPVQNAEMMSTTKQLQVGEHPSATANCSARGLALIAAAMANKGTLDNFSIMKEDTWEMMHHDPTEKVMLGKRTCFTQGGINKFSMPDKPNLMEKSNEGRKGFWGWMGVGGSVFQWHPELCIGVGYVPTLLEWFDLDNIKAANLQREIVKCVKAIKGIADDPEKPLAMFEGLAPHRFEEKSYRHPTFCDYCGGMLLGIMRQGMQCKGCQCNIHHKCQDLMDNSCYDSELSNLNDSAKETMDAILNIGEKQTVKIPEQVVDIAMEAIPAEDLPPVEVS